MHRAAPSTEMRFGLVGCGTHAQWEVIPAFTACSAVKLVAVADQQKNNLEKSRADSLALISSFVFCQAGSRYGTG